MTSPNDPVFFLHHCFVDKIWADWQELQAKDNMSPNPNYAPEKDGPLGHNLDDELSRGSEKSETYSILQN